MVFSFSWCSLTLLLFYIRHANYNPRSECQLLEFLLIPLTLLLLDLFITPLLPLEILQVEGVVGAGRGADPASDVGTESAVLLLVLLSAALGLVLQLHLFVFQGDSLGKHSTVPRCIAFRRCSCELSRVAWIYPT
jgi:hypothetical protein